MKKTPVIVAAVMAAALGGCGGGTQAPAREPSAAVKNHYPPSFLPAFMTTCEAASGGPGDPNVAGCKCVLADLTAQISYEDVVLAINDFSWSGMLDNFAVKCPGVIEDSFTPGA